MTIYRTMLLLILALSAMFVQASVSDTLPSPGNVRVANVTHEGFTAEWDAVGGAVSDMVRRYVTAAAMAPHNHMLLEEGSDKANGGTMDNVSYVTDISEITESGGWRASAAARSECCFVFCLDALSGGADYLSVACMAGEREL